MDNRRSSISASEDRHYRGAQVLLLVEPEMFKYLSEIAAGVDRRSVRRSFQYTNALHRPLSLPNPDYIAIHATIAGVLNMSGAGRFFDELLDKYKDDEGKVPPVRSWSELEKVMEEEMLRESVSRSLQSVQAC